jgi:hypothetical protein
MAWTAEPLPPELSSSTRTPPRAHGNGNGNGNGSASTGNGHGAAHRFDRHPARLSAEQPHIAHHAPVTPVEAEPGNAETVRFVRPTDLDAPVQLLPGRLEVIGGETPHREIRFMRVPGEPAHVILGRELRLAPHYVGLGSPTVSRRHARFDFTDGHWVVRNLSRTNPLVVNDVELFDTDAARTLVDGDRLELGDVILRFHGR